MPYGENDFLLPCSCGGDPGDTPKEALDGFVIVDGSEEIDDVDVLIVEGGPPNVDLEAGLAPPNGENNFLGPKVSTVSTSLTSRIVRP